MYPDFRKIFTSHIYFKGLRGEGYVCVHPARKKNIFDQYSAVDNSVDKVWISLAICNHLYYIDCHKIHFLTSHFIRVRPPSLIS
jgi:hypothetical protein